jgi:UTP--glucose-1-phosphate uridylyltransferase
MRIRKAIVTAAGPGQDALPLHLLVDRDGVEKTAIEMIIEEIDSAGIDSIGVIVNPGSQGAYREAAGKYHDRLTFIEQVQVGAGYGQAILAGRDFAGGEPFLHMVGDHLCFSKTPKRCAMQLCEVASKQGCMVSAVQATRESLLPEFGTIGGVRLQDLERVIEVKQVIEKPTPTQAEQELTIAGFRSGTYLCFFGMHVLMPSIFPRLEEVISKSNGPVPLTLGLQVALRRERYLGYEIDGYRYNIGVKYGLLQCQLALGLSGVDRDRILTQLIDLLSIHR